MPGVVVSKRHGVCHLELKLSGRNKEVVAPLHSSHRYNTCTGSIIYYRTREREKEGEGRAFIMRLSVT